MKTWVHLLASSILALALYPLFNWKVLFVIVGGVLIDIDHYFWYIYKFRKFSLLNCYGYFIDGMDKDRIMKNRGILLVFHTIEFLLMAVLLSFYNELVLMFTIGLLLHYLLDGIFLYNVAKRLIVNPSIISWLSKNLQIQKV